MSDEQVDPTLLPVPFEVELWVAIIKRPLVAATILSIPLAVLVIAADWFLGLAPGILPFWYRAVSAWIAGTLTLWVLFSRPY